MEVSNSSFFHKIRSQMQKSTLIEKNPYLYFTKKPKSSEVSVYMETYENQQQLKQQANPFILNSPTYNNNGTSQSNMNNSNPNGTSQTQLCNSNTGVNKGEIQMVQQQNYPLLINQQSSLEPINQLQTQNFSIQKHQSKNIVNNSPGTPEFSNFSLTPSIYDRSPTPVKIIRNNSVYNMESPLSQSHNAQINQVADIYSPPLEQRKNERSRSRDRERGKQSKISQNINNSSLSSQVQPQFQQSQPNNIKRFNTSQNQKLSLLNNSLSQSQPLPSTHQSQIQQQQQQQLQQQQQQQQQPQFAQGNNSGNILNYSIVNSEYDSKNTIKKCVNDLLKSLKELTSLSQKSEIREKSKEILEGLKGLKKYLIFQECQSILPFVKKIKCGIIRIYNINKEKNINLIKGQTFQYLDMLQGLKQDNLQFSSEIHKLKGELQYLFENIQNQQDCQNQIESLKQYQYQTSLETNFTTVPTNNNNSTHSNQYVNLIEVSDINQEIKKFKQILHQISLYYDNKIRRQSQQTGPTEQQQQSQQLTQQFHRQQSQQQQQQQQSVQNQNNYYLEDFSQKNQIQDQNNLNNTNNNITNSITTEENNITINISNTLTTSNIFQQKSLASLQNQQSGENNNHHHHHSSFDNLNVLSINNNQEDEEEEEQQQNNGENNNNNNNQIQGQERDRVVIQGQQQQQQQQQQQNNSNFEIQTDEIINYFGHHNNTGNVNINTSEKHVNRSSNNNQFTLNNQ